MLKKVSLSLVAMTTLSFSSGLELYEDPITKQVFTEPAEGRVKLGSFVNEINIADKIKKELKGSKTEVYAKAKTNILINSDNIKIGSIGAEFLGKELKGKGTILLFEGLLKADVTQDRTKGFMDTIAQYKAIKVIKRTGNYLRKDALIEMEKLIKEGIHVDAIFAESDSMLSGVRTALRHHKIDPSTILMVGCDYTSEAKEAIKKGAQTASVLLPLGGNFAVEMA